MLNTTKIGSATLMLPCAISTCFFFSRYQALTLNTREVPTSQEATNTCMMRGKNEGVKAVSRKFVMTAMGPVAVCWIA